MRSARLQVFARRSASSCTQQRDSAGAGEETGCRPACGYRHTADGRLPRRTHQLIGATLAALVDGERLGIREGQVLHHDHTADAACGIDPEEGVVDAAPAHAAGRALTRYLVDRDEEA